MWLLDTGPPFSEDMRFSVHPYCAYIYIHSEGDQPWDFFGRNDARAEAPVLWPPHAKS